MLLLATDWGTLSALATALGTLVLAVATFAAVRSSNRSALIAEVALQEQRRPILVPSSLDDPLQKLSFADGVWIKAAGGHATAKLVEGNVYLGINVRNVGNGIGVLQGWAVRAGQTLTSQMPVHMPDADFRMQTRDFYVPGNGVGMWQGALRNPEDPMRPALVAAIEAGAPITVELLYSDLTGRQRAITRFGLLPFGGPARDGDERGAAEDRGAAADPGAAGDPGAAADHGAADAPGAAVDRHAADDGDRLAAMSRLWFLDFEGPRPDSDELQSAIAAVQSQTGGLGRASSQP